MGVKTSLGFLTKQGNNIPWVLMILGFCSFSLVISYNASQTMLLLFVHLSFVEEHFGVLAVPMDS